MARETRSKSSVKSDTKSDAKSTREKLVIAAAQEFNAHGYQGTNTNKIARAAGFAPATFYRHFDDKRQAMMAAFEWLINKQRAAVFKVIQEYGVDDLEGAARRIVQSLVEHQRQWPTLITSWTSMASADPEARLFLREKRSRDLDSIALLRQQFCGKPSSREDDMLMLMSVEGLCLLVATDDPEKLNLSTELLVDRMTARIVGHLSTPAEP